VNRRGEHYGREIREPAQEKAERIIAEELKPMGWEESDLERHRKGAAQKLKIALRLRQQTTMTLAWIAQRVQMGTKTHLSHLLYWMSEAKVNNTDSAEKPKLIENEQSKTPPKRSTHFGKIVCGAS